MSILLEGQWPLFSSHRLQLLKLQRMLRKKKEREEPLKIRKRKRKERESKVKKNNIEIHGERK